MFTRKFNYEIETSMKQRKMLVEKLTSDGSSANFKVNDGNTALTIVIDNYGADDHFGLEGKETIKSNQLFDFDFVNSKLIDATILGYQKVYGSTIFYSNELTFEKDNKVLKLVSKN